MPKSTIRQNLLAQRRALESAEQLSLSLAAQQRLITASPFQRASCVALYAPIHNEVQTAALQVAALQEGKRLCYPRVSGESLAFVAITGPDDLSRGAFGIAEPAGDQLVRPEAIDLAVVPGVGFDRSGCRLGYGGGYYDRAISAGRPKTLVGLAFEFQLLEELPAEDHDICVDMIVTDTELLAFK